MSDELPALADLLALPDSELIQWRHKAWARLERDPDSTEGLRLTALYDMSTAEVAERAAKAWGLYPARADHTELRRFAS